MAQQQPPHQEPLQQQEQPLQLPTTGPQKPSQGTLAARQPQR